MYCLYIDTHFSNLVIAILRDGKVVEEKVIESAKHSQYTMNLIQEVMRDCNVVIDDIKEIIIINGPGSFTGVRIGVVIAKIMGYTKNIILKPISYLQAASLSYDEEILLGLADKNGVFAGKFNKEHMLVDDYFYVSNKDDNKLKITLVADKIDIAKVYAFLKDKPGVLPHNLKPLYIKKLEVQHD